MANLWEDTLIQIEKVISEEIAWQNNAFVVKPNHVDQIYEILSDNSSISIEPLKVGKGRNAYLPSLGLSNRYSADFWESNEPDALNDYKSIENQLLKYTLYFDSILITDGIQTAIEHGRVAHKLTASEIDRRLAQNVLSPALRFWSRLRPLTASGIIQVVPHTNVTKRWKSEECGLLNGLDFKYPDALETAAKYISDILGEPRWIDTISGSYLHQESEVPAFNSALLFCRDFGYEYVPTSLYQTAKLQAKTGLARKLFKDVGLHLDSNLTFSLCNLPTVDSITPNEVISLHSDESEFVKWRSELHSIIDKIDVNKSLSFERVIAKEIPVIQQNLEKELSTTMMKSRVRTAAIGMGAGFVGTVSATAEPVSSLISSVTAGVSGLLASILFERPSSSSESLRSVHRVMLDLEKDKSIRLL